MGIFSFFGQGSPPSGATSGSVGTGSTDLGLQFQVQQPGCQLSGWWVYVPSGGTVTGSSYTFALYSTPDGTTGTQLGSVVTGSGTFTAAAWNFVPASAPLALAPGTVYVAAYHFGANIPYEYAPGYWTSGAGSSGLTAGPLSAPANGSALGTGTQDYNQPAGASVAMPVSNFSGSWYGLDVSVIQLLSGSRIQPPPVWQHRFGASRAPGQRLQLSPAPPPVSSTAVFGTASFTGGTAGGQTGLIVGTRYQATASGTLVSLSCYTPGSGSVTAAVYADSSGAPGSLIAAQNTPVTATAGAYTTVTMPGGTSITSGTFYWLTFNTSSANREFITGTANQTAYDSSLANTWGSNFPSTFPTPAYQGNDYLAYATLQVSGGGGGGGGGNSAVSDSDAGTGAETEIVSRPSTLLAALKNRLAAPVSIPVIGDSVTEGCWVSSVQTRWTANLASSLRQSWPTPGSPGGLGFLPLLPSVRTEAFFLLTESGSPSTVAVGPTVNSPGMTAASSFVFTAPSSPGTTSVRVMYVDSATAGAWSYQVNAGTVHTVTNGGTGDGALTPSIPMSAGDTLTIAWVSGSAYPEGILHYNGDELAGIQVHALGRSGWTCALWNSNGTSSTWADMAVLASGAIAICLGINDARFVTAAQYKADLLTLISKVRSNAALANLDLLLIIPYQTTQTFVDGSWPPYETAALQAAAATTACYVTDLTALMPTAAADPGFYYTDGVHLIDASSLLMGQDSSTSTLSDINANIDSDAAAGADGGETVYRQDFSPGAALVSPAWLTRWGRQRYPRVASGIYLLPGGPRPDSETAHGEDSGFAALADADAGTGADAHLLLFSDRDASGAGAERELTAWPGDSDGASTHLGAGENGYWAGGLKDADASASADASAPFFFTLSDAVTGADTAVIEVYTYQPLFRWTGGSFSLVLPARPVHRPPPEKIDEMREFTLWQGERPDGTALRLYAAFAAGQLHFVSDRDASGSREEGEAASLQVAVHVAPALSAGLEVS